MAKTTAPLLSFDAAGQIGKSIVFSKWRGISYSRRYTVPANPKTTSQTFQRNSFATLREMWKRIGTVAREPWNAYAAGRPFLGFNAFIGENRLLIGTDTDMTSFEGSPGANGGIPLAAFAAVAGSGSGEIDVTWTAPTLPTGWAIAEMQCLAFVDQAPNAIFPGGAVEDTDNSDPYAVTLSGLTAGGDYVIAGWAKYTKPDGSYAYSVSITDTATATA